MEERKSRLYSPLFLRSFGIQSNFIQTAPKKKSVEGKEEGPSKRDHRPLLIAAESAGIDLASLEAQSFD